MLLTIVKREINGLIRNFSSSRKEINGNDFSLSILMEDYLFFVVYTFSLFKWFILLELGFWIGSKIG